MRMNVADLHYHPVDCVQTGPAVLMAGARPPDLPHRRAVHPVRVTAEEHHRPPSPRMDDHR